MKPNKIGIIAPSSKVPQIEFNLGIEHLKNEGFDVDVHPQCTQSHWYFAGNDEVRANAFFDFATRSDLSVLWCARGGHGAIRLLPLLEKLAKSHGLPQKKLLVGYSDATALMEFVRQKWGWSILHAPMPSLRRFTLLESTEWSALKNWIAGKSAKAPWAKKRLKAITSVPKTPVRGTLVGGNLTVWNCLLGTPYQGMPDDCLVFFEDIDEGLYRVDRMMQQLLISGSLNRIRGIILGNF